MKRCIPILLILFLFSSLLPAQNYKKVKIFYDKLEDIASLQNSGMEFDHPSRTKDNAIVVFLNDKDFDILQHLGFNYEVLIDDWFKYYNNQPVLTDAEKQNFINDSKVRYNVDGFGFGSMGGFYTYQEVVNELDSMYAQFPNLITQKYSIGTSIEGRTIWAVKISDNPNISENEPSVGFDAIVHAREPASMSTQLYFIWYMLENYGTDPEVTYLINNREIYCVPVFNPDGYERNHQTNPNGGGMWRKNRRNNGGGCYGIDLNRNFSYKWGYDNIGSSPDPCSDTYRGTGPMSEPESQAVSNHVLGKNINTYFNMHAYGDDFLYPWGYINQACPDEDTYLDFCIDMSAINGFDYGISGYILGYNSNGTVRDWLYGDQVVINKIYGYTMEIGNSSDGFWPLQSRIFPIAQNSLGTLIYNTWVAGDYVLFENANFNQQYFNPGDVVDLSPSFKNKGLASAYNLTIDLSSTSSYVTILNGTVNFDSLEARTSSGVPTPLSFSIAANTPFEELIALTFKTYSNGLFMSERTVNIVIGTPMYIFSDTTNNPTSLWTITASPINPKWEATTTSYYSAPNSYTDSKTGNYVSNATVTMTLTDPIDLSSYTNPRLTFWTKYDIESNWDYGQVEISTNNGGTWYPLEGLYTEPGVGTFQPNGEPVYDGTQLNWVKEEISLTGYTSDQVKIKFELKSDGSINKDGWYVDDIGIFIYGAVPVELTSFNVKTSSDGIILRWTTATELNNNGFEIQRTVDYINASTKNWETLEFVNGYGTTNEIHQYYYRDEHPLSGKSYYRLKQIDYDGSFTYSEEIEADYGTIKEYYLGQNYPNPFNPSTVINYAIPVPGNVSIKLYDALGSEIISLFDEYMEAGSHNFIFNTEDYPGKIVSGVYFYTIKSGSYTQTKKMMVLK